MGHHEANVSSGETVAYAVFRNGFRVSDATYPAEFYAKHELDYWRGIIKKWPDGSRIDVRKLRPRAPRQEQKTNKEQTAE